MLKIEELKRKTEKCPKMDKNVHLRTGPKWTSQGITLIALIITIIILLILAGVTIGTLTGDNSLINQAGEAKEEAEVASEKEAIDNATIEAMGKNKYGNLEEGEFQNALDSQTGGKAEVTDIGNSFEVYFTDSRRYYEVDSDGNIGDSSMAVTDPYPGDITKDENGETLTGDSEESAYQINCIEDLVAFSNMTNGTGKYFQDGQLKEVSGPNDMAGKYIVLTRNLNFKSKSSYIDSQRTDFGDINGDNSDGNALMTEMTTGRGFKSIGKVTGICFDGNNNEIKNLYIKKEDWNHIALFSNISDHSKLTNLTVSGTIIGNRYVALIIIAGNGGEGIIVDGCTNKCNIIGENYIGGIFPYINHGNIEITNCKNEGKIESRSTEVDYMGGIVANNDSGNCIIDSCYNLGEVISKDYVGTNATHIGGITGNNKGKIINCYNKGTTAYGLVAINQGKIENCYNVGNCYLNAMINNNYYTNSSVINSYTLNQANIKLVKNTSTGKVDSLSRIVKKDELKSKEFVTILNNGQSGVWIYDENKINDGYPILNCSIVL